MTASPLDNMALALSVGQAFVISALLAVAATKVRLLTRNGAAAAVGVGTVVLGLGGWKFLIPLLTFFLSSSLLSKLAASRRPTASALHAKNEVRDAGQVLANSGIAIVLVLVYRLVVYRWPVYETRYLLMLFLAALATVNADTWATEIGALAGRAPRLLRDGSIAAPGASGAVSLPGTLGSLAGSALIPLLMAFHQIWRLNAPEIIAVVWAGFMGALCDSLLGATVQVHYRDPATGRITERAIVEGRKTVQVRGWKWVNNDMVNFLASVVGVAVAWGVLRYGAYGHP